MCSRDDDPTQHNTDLRAVRSAEAVITNRTSDSCYVCRHPFRMHAHVLTAEAGLTLPRPVLPVACVGEGAIGGLCLCPVVDVS